MKRKANVEQIDKQREDKQTKKIKRKANFKKIEKKGKKET